MTASEKTPENLLALVGAGLELDDRGEAMWLDVISKIDEVYSDLLRYEVDLERKNAELEAAQSFISSVVNSVSDILVVADRNGIILQVNPAFARLVGKAGEAIVGTALDGHIVAECRDQARSLMAAHHGVKEAEVRFVTPNGPSDLMAVNCAARFDSDGKPVGAVLTGRPIGELRRAYEALNLAHIDLQRAQRKLIEQEKMASLGRLVAGVAHELNNPISFVYGNIHTLDRYRKSIESYLDALHGWAGPGDMPKLRRSLEIDTIVGDLQPLIEGTLEGAMRIAEIVKNLRRLSFTKSADRQEIEIGRLIRTAVAWATRAKNVRADVTIDVSDDLVLSGHEGQIHQVLVNLVDNAIDAIKGVETPRLDFQARQEGEDIVVEIGDSGPGIPDAVMDKIFEPFFTTKTVGEGTGLGLWISYSIVREHGGSLTAGRSPLGGALFTLRLPRR